MTEMTARELIGIATEAERATTQYEDLRHKIQAASSVFDFDQPLPPLRKHRPRQEWETQEPTNETP